ncbi:hypothetical protein A2635_00880 [Candidatus Peribacteria bacterium RIFCSPHIGHO2_01_FULL_51_9]|nr:MAG: hypothetical protein A2635_00880 [Candidatus Peribacteria bacterium RIFCSPHIGHO2_01_FULL_51_9]
MPKPVLCIVGIGYVGLPLAHAFAVKGYTVFGYDVSAKRIAELQKHGDRTNELTEEQLQSVHIEFTTDPTVIQKTDIIIMAIPTPVDEKNLPDLTMLRESSFAVGQNLKRGAIVVYESTVYPGVTEEICGPILEKASGMICGKDFTLGYSPERINPGDKEHTITKIKKIVAGQDDRTTDLLCDLYGSIVTAGIHRAPNIKTAEMAKAIENAQRDLNIAYINEVALLCNALGISTKEVLQAAGTKWNFLPFKPGLVGGHCIGVDPFYLVHKAKELGITTHVITAGRAVNDGMAKFIAQRVFSEIPKPSKSPHILVLGLTFKENIPDTRNSKSFDVIEHFKAMGCSVESHDPFIQDKPLMLEDSTYDAILLLVPHKEYGAVPSEKYIKALKKNGVFYDLKSLFNAEAFQRSGRKYLAL